VSALSSQPSYVIPGSTQAAAGKLIVLVTEQDWEDPIAPSRIWGWAAENGLHVLLLGLYLHTEEETRLRRHLVSLAAAIRDSRVSTEIQVQLGDSWIEKVRAIWRPGDILVCYDGADVGIGQRPLDQVLLESFEAPVHILPAQPEAHGSRAKVLPKALSWAGSIGVVVGFFFLQVWIVQWLHDWGQTALLSLSVVFEMALIWLWDSLIA